MEINIYETKQGMVARFPVKLGCLPGFLVCSFAGPAQEFVGKIVFLIALLDIISIGFVSR